MFDNCSRRNPPDVGYWRGYSALSVRRRQYVMLSPSWFWNAPISLPTSHSVPISGRRSGFPRFPGASPGPRSDGSATNVVNLSKAPGCRPDCPMAARSRRVGTRAVKAEWPQPAIALGMTDTLAFG